MKRHNPNQQDKSSDKSPLPTLLKPTGQSTKHLSLHQASRKALSTPPKQRTYETSKESVLGGRLASAAHRLRYDAVLEAVKHMGKDVRIQEYHQYAVCTRTHQFAAVRPLANGTICVGIAADPAHDERLEPSDSAWGSQRITAQFLLNTHEPIRGWQLGMLRHAYQQAT